MRKLGLVSLLAGSLVLGSCSAGPSQMRRTVDDWDNQLYVDSPWIDNFLHIIPVVPLAALLGSVVDTLVLNPIQFWSDDAWDSHGVGFEHMPVKPQDGVSKSLLFSDAKVLGVHR